MVLSACNFWVPEFPNQLSSTYLSAISSIKIITGKIRIFPLLCILHFLLFYVSIISTVESSHSGFVVNSKIYIFVLNVKIASWAKGDGVLKLLKKKLKKITKKTCFSLVLHTTNLLLKKPFQIADSLTSWGHLRILGIHLTQPKIILKNYTNSYDTAKIISCSSTV